MGFQWDPKLSVGVGVIDEQHKELFRRADALVRAMAKANAQDEVNQLTTYLASYVVEHFSTEERLMASRGYPQAAAHLLQHRRFVADFVALKEDLEKNGASTAVAVKLTSFVGGWLRAHIGKTDLLLGKFLLQQTAKTC